MADKTGIAWTDATWNPLRGCSKVSAGCKNCYAEKVASRFSGPGAPYEGTIRDGRWSGQIRLVPELLSQPLKWKRPRRIFVNSMSDLFHEGVSFEYIAAVFAVMATARRHTFQVLTKQPSRALEFFRWVSGVRCAGSSSKTTRDAYAGSCTVAGFHVGELCDVFDSADPWPIQNVHLGVSVEDQSTADARIPLLLQCPAAVHFASYEPALSAVDWRDWWIARPGFGGNYGAGRLDWIIIGGESGPGARPFHLGWALSVIRQCREPGVAVFVKQLGARPILSEDEPRFRDRAGADPSEWPEDLRVQEFPA